MGTAFIPEIGSFLSLRGREWLVQDIDAAEQPHVVRLACVSDDAQGETAEVILDAEVAAAQIDTDPWSAIGKNGTDSAPVFAAFLRTLKWKSATAAERDLFQAPFRAGIRLDTYQLLPLRKALRLPRVNLLIADDVGLGKTVEASAFNAACVQVRARSISACFWVSDFDSVAERRASSAYCRKSSALDMTHLWVMSPH